MHSHLGRGHMELGHGHRGGSRGQGCEGDILGVVVTRIQ